MFVPILLALILGLNFGEESEEFSGSIEEILSMVKRGNVNLVVSRISEQRRTLGLKLLEVAKIDNFGGHDPLYRRICAVKALGELRIDDDEIANGLVELLVTSTQISVCLVDEHGIDLSIKYIRAMRLAFPDHVQSTLLKIGNACTPGILKQITNFNRNFFVTPRRPPNYAALEMDHWIRLKLVKALFKIEGKERAEDLLKKGLENPKDDFERTAYKNALECLNEYAELDDRVRALLKIEGRKRAEDLLQTDIYNTNNDDFERIKCKEALKCLIEYAELETRSVEKSMEK